jgi:hypothetical protein
MEDERMKKRKSKSKNEGKKKKEKRTKQNNYLEEVCKVFYLT